MNSAVLKSFRFRILLSFLAFIGVLFIWISVFILLNQKQKQLQNFVNGLSTIQNQFLESNRHLESFILLGYHGSEFYLTGKQNDIDDFLEKQKRCTNALLKIKKVAKEDNLPLQDRLDILYKLQNQLQDSVNLLKFLYLKKGFKDFGTEGKMRFYAHELENLSLIKETDLLQLRRHEKDFLLRADPAYATKFNFLMDSLLVFYNKDSVQNEILLNYKSYFNSLVKYTSQLGLNSGYGVYINVQNIIDKIGDRYNATYLDATVEVNKLREVFVEILVGVSLLLMGVVVLLSLYLARNLTKDLKTLNLRMQDYINSGFANESKEKEPFQPTTIEIARLNNDFLLLKDRLKSIFQKLEGSIAEVKKTSDYKSTFLANMSHEIRTPLNGVIGMVQLLKELQISAKESDYLNTIEFSANHLLDLINMILDYSKIEAGKIDLHNIPFDLKGDMQKVIRLFTYMLEEKGLKLELSIDFESDFYLLGDSVRLQQVVINLINNAIKFTNQGIISLKVKQIPIPNSANCKLRFDVVDTGIGIPEIQAENIFQAFHQIGNSKSQNFGGTGLGLTISYQLVKLMGGELAFRSKENIGTDFFFELEFSKGEKIMYQAKSQIVPYLKFDKPNILLVEDNIINQKVISLLLKQKNLLVELATDGLEALELYKANDYDLILMDIRMPKMDGLQATMEIHKTEKFKLKHTPIIAITANAFNEDRKYALEAGMDDFLSKPIKTMELEGVLGKYLPSELQIDHINSKGKKEMTN